MTGCGGAHDVAALGAVGDERGRDRNALGVGPHLHAMRFPPRKRPDAPDAGAENPTVIPGVGSPSLSVTVTASRIGKRVPAAVDSAAATPAAIAAGLPGRLRSVKLAAFVVPVVVAVAVKVPAVVFAVSRGEVAIPEALVVSVAWLLPPTNVAAAALAEPAPPLPWRRRRG